MLKPFLMILDMQDATDDTNAVTSAPPPWNLKGFKNNIYFKKRF